MTVTRYIRYILLALTGVLAACEDKIPFDDLVIGEGESNLRFEVSLHSLDPALHSRAAAGNAVESINELWVVIYQVEADGSTTLFRKILASSLDDYQVKNVDDTREDPDAGGDKTVYPEEGVDFGGNIEPVADSTPRATFKINGIPYGRYKIYAVANIADLPDEICATEDDLRSHRCDWNTDVTKDAQMFGYFTLNDKRRSSGFDADVITVKDSQLTLHSWIRRLVSKVTVSFDPSELKENVRVYVKSITIRDIPMSCPLGKYNTPLNSDSLIYTGDSYDYYTDETASYADYKDWLTISKGLGPQGQVDHKESNPSLYFYENMQGDWKDKGEAYLKEQITDESSDDRVGTPIDSLVQTPTGYNDFKDRIRYGTYIEVDAYYESRNKEKISQGPIKYRFMLGKNITYNYNAERNYHYKLTLKLRGFANEADWHISYKEYTPTLITPEPYYISYLYNQEMDFPARVILPEEWDKSKYYVKAEIVENNWWPWDRDANKGKGARPSGTIGSSDDINGFAWNTASLTAYPPVTYDSKTYDGDPYKGGNYVGFLSLRPNTADIIGTDEEVQAVTGGLDTYGYGAHANEYLEWYYKTNNLAINTYSLTGPGSSLDPIDKSVRLKIPMYTRNKEMVPPTDFTGNNPFNSYYRYAKVRFTLWEKTESGDKAIDFKNEKDEWETERLATIYQVPRIENPKAIYRDAGNDEAFDIKLMILPKAGTSTYETFKSDGPWKAYVMCQTEDFIELYDRHGTKSTNGTIEGSTDETIEFTYKPAGKIGDDKTRCGIIKVEYHDYNCFHLIFVRQGYHQGVKLGDATWSCYNVYATSRGGTNPNLTANDPSDQTDVPVALTKSPLSVGSLLKRNQYNYSIKEVNVRDGYGWLVNITGKDLKTSYIKSDKTVGERTATWAGIQGFGWTNYAAGGATQERYSRHWADTWTACGGFRDNETFTVPTGADFQSLLANAKFGYGIVYADGANTTFKEFADACGFMDCNNDGIDDEPSAEGSRGVRACIAYEDTYGKNIIFPLGAIGQARRNKNGPTAGTLSYGGLAGLLSSALYRPYTYNLYRETGSIYWIYQPVTISGTKDGNLGKPWADYASWDINYYVLRFFAYDSDGSLGGWIKKDKKYSNSGVNSTNASDALPIKLIYKNQP